jgi:uncharacterized membrane-anchored protein
MTCGSPIFAHDPQEEAAMNTEPNLIEVYSAANDLDAHTVQAALVEAGIAAVVDERNTFGGLQGDVAPRVMVDESVADEARALIAKVEHNRWYQGDEETAAEESTCLRCGKPLAPTEESCSACGWSFRQADGADPVGPM